MKRIQLFEFEDLSWFPDVLRRCMTRMISVVHRWLKTDEKIAEILEAGLVQSGRRHVVDLCSGDGGPMIAVMKRLRESDRWEADSLNLTLTDLYPNQTTATRVENAGDPNVQYQRSSVDAAAQIPFAGECMRTMVCSFHHMPIPLAKRILQAAVDARDPILIYEISDNSAAPKLLWWVGLPINFVFGVVVAAFTRPMTLTQFFFSFVVPVLPVCFAWDGAVSNARTYTPDDLATLLEDVHGDYEWKIDRVDARPAKHLYLLGMPKRIT
ncbi:MAG TPA: hypothetical protein DDW52_20330 [Planctomycetaceae bacterium]|nr:hypothetical protein [Planctomycetaceae bacterium]